MLFPDCDRNYSCRYVTDAAWLASDAGPGLLEWHRNPPDHHGVAAVVWHCVDNRAAGFCRHRFCVVGEKAFGDGGEISAAVKIERPRADREMPADSVWLWTKPLPPVNPSSGLAGPSNRSSVHG